MSPTADPRVLVVDDEEGPREAIRMILKPHYQVYLAASGEEVLLCWRLGEDEIGYWHGLEDGFSGRRPLPL